MHYQKTLLKNSEEATTTNSTLPSVDKASQVDESGVCLALPSGGDQNRLTSTWWPGDISDQSISQSAKKAMIKQAETLFEQGQVVRVSGGAKPRANFLSLSHAVRFLIRDDIRYAVCDCSDEAPCAHAILAVKCFRLVEARVQGQLVETAPRQEQPTDLLETIETSLNSFLDHGLDSSNKESIRLLTLAKQNSERLCNYFISELLDDLLQYREQYLLGDAAVSPEQLSAKLGELVARIDAANYRSGEKPLPLTLILGGKWNAPQAIKKISITSLGLTAVQLRKQTILTCYAIDSRSGQLCRIEKTYSNTSANQTSFEELARKPIIKNNSMADLAAANLLVTGAKLSPSRILTIGRNPVVVNPHNYNWENLPASIYHTDFAELQSTIEGEHPSFLTDKTSNSSLKVAKIKACTNKSFDYGEQSLVATCEDQFGEVANLKLPYRTRAAQGFELLTKALADHNFELKYIAGFWGYAGMKLTVHPITLVFENSGARAALQPAVARTFNWPDESVDNGQTLQTCQSNNRNSDVLPSVEILRQVGVMVSKGLLRIDNRDIQALRELLQECEVCGSKLLFKAIENVIKVYEKPYQSGLDEEPEFKKSIKELLLVAFVINQESSTYKGN